MSQLILQSFRRFTYVRAYSPTLPYVSTYSPSLPSLYLRHSLFSNPSLRHNSFSNPSVAFPTSQFILQAFFRFSYVTVLHLRHLASRPCNKPHYQLWCPGFSYWLGHVDNFWKVHHSLHSRLRVYGFICNCIFYVSHLAYSSALCIQMIYHRPHFTASGSWNKSLHIKPLQRCYYENSGSSASASVMRRHYSITYMQSLHEINYLLSVRNLLCGRHSYRYVVVVGFYDTF